MKRLYFFLVMFAITIFVYGQKSVHAQQTAIFNHTRRLFSAVQQIGGGLDLPGAKKRSLPDAVTLASKLPVYKPQHLNNLPVMPTLNAEQLYNAGCILYSRGDTANAIQSFRLAAMKGHAQAQCNYGVFLLQGKGVKADKKQGWQWIRKAAKQNEPFAMQILGNEYYYGTVFPKDTIIGFQMLTKAADAGHFYAQLQVGDIYYYNRFDTVTAIKYYAIADEYAQQWPDYVFLNNYQPCIAQADYLLGDYYYFSSETTRDVDLAIKYWINGCRWGDIVSAYNLGILLTSGTETSQDIPCGVRYMRFAAENGYTDAQAYLGDYCMEGFGMEKDSLEAIQWYKKAAEAGHAGARYCLTMYYNDACDNDSTILWGNTPECRDSSLVQYFLGWAYYGKAEIENAITWWRKAAEQNLADACWTLYALNETELKDSIASLYYLKKAAELGYVDAIAEMGYSYFWGEYVEKDEEKGLEYLERASELGCTIALRNLGAIYYWKEYGRKNYKLAADYWKRGAELGNADCQYCYGVLLKKGRGVKKDKKAAIYWLKLAAMNDSEEAKEALQKMGISLETVAEAQNTKEGEPQPTMKRYRVTGVDSIGISVVEERTK